MSKFKIVNRIIDGKNVEVEIGHNTLQYVLINRLTGMRFFGTKKHKLKIKNSIKKARIKNLKDKGFSDEEIEKFLDEIVIYKWRIFTESSFNRYIKVIKRFCKYLKEKFQTSHLTMFEAEKYIQEYIDVREARGLSADTLNTDLSALCKVFGRRTIEFRHPPRHGAHLKNDPTKYNTETGETTRDVGVTTGLRRRELAHLKVDDIKFIDSETVHIFSIGKGGKHNRTVLKGIVAVAKLKEYISRAEKTGNDFLLTKAEARVPDGLHYCRAMCAQNTYYAVLQDMENDPAKRAEYIQKIKDEFKRCKRKLKEDLNKPYCLRGYNKKAAESINKPVVYDRVAAMYVSLFILHHFRTNTTILHYLVKQQVQPSLSTQNGCVGVAEIVSPFTQI